MNILISLFIIGLSLSMDTFSICLSIGTFNISSLKIIKLTLFVGLMHFFMPLLGSLIGIFIVDTLNLNVHFLLGLILLFIGIEMILDFKNDNKEFNLNTLGLLLISLSVSLDSFSTGIGIKAICNNVFLAGFIFSICAASFTYLGLLIGKYSNKKLGNYAKIIGIIILFVLGIYFLFE